MDDTTKIELSKTHKKDSLDSLFRFFGHNEEVIKTIKKRPEFWKAGKVPLGEITIENLAKRPIQEIPLKEMLPLIKKVYETSRVVDTIEIDKESIILFHNYRKKDAIDKLIKTLVMLLEANGHLYEAKSTANMIVLTHRPDIGTKINEIVNFKKAFELIDSKIHRESEWKTEGKNLVYIIKKCNIASEGEKFDMYLCHTGREAFKGALSYAFGNKAELEIKKLISHKDKFCEVLIKIP